MAHRFNMRFSMARNRYERFADTDNALATSMRVLQTDNGWESCHHTSTNIQYKVERDWQMAYLARAEDTSRASISWVFDFSSNGLRVQNAQLRFDTKTYEDGVVELAIMDAGGELLNQMI